MTRARRSIFPPRGETAPPSFVELPSGLFTAAGTWFHVTRSDLEDYAGDVLLRIPLERLVDDAEAVLRSPQTLGIWTLLVTLLFGSPLQAVVTAALVFAGWSCLSPGLVTLPGVKLYRMLQAVWLQALAYVLGLSFLANGGGMLAVGVGLTGFIALRWGLLERVFRPLVSRVLGSLYALPVADQALRAVIVRYALAGRIPLPQVDEMEARMLAIARYRRNESNDS